MRLSHIDHGKSFDWGKTSADYARYRDIYPNEFYERLLAYGIGTKGQRVLDLGTGTGVLPRAMARFGAQFTGVDLSENQIAQAKRLTHQVGLSIDYLVAPAEDTAFRRIRSMRQRHASVSGISIGKRCLPSSGGC